MTRAIGLAAVMVRSMALACGGFFAQGVEVAADQKIIITHRDGVETYTFRPHFCGTATDFGVILPLPSVLSTSPSLASNALFEQLDTLTATKVVEECASSGVGCGAGAPDRSTGGADPGSNGVGVIDRGHVGVFDYVLLQATSASAFTDWLDQNGFPRGGASDEVYASYVAKRWYFVAFKVSAGGEAPAAGQKLCGDLGPIQLSFASAAPVVPARIASVNGGGGTWRLFTIAAHQQVLDPASAGFTSRLHFSGSLDQATLSAFPAIGDVAHADERLTVLDAKFSVGTATTDLTLLDGPQRDFRSTLVVTKSCVVNCSTGLGSGAGALAGLGLWLVYPRRRRARRV